MKYVGIGHLLRCNVKVATLPQDQPDDYVIATGVLDSVRDFLDLAGSYCGLDWTEYVVTDPRYFRPSETGYLCGDFTKARNQLGWTPRVGFRELVHMMVEHDLELASREAMPQPNRREVLLQIGAVPKTYA
jgi:GDPmannose 4,6-dehydratase